MITIQSFDRQYAMAASHVALITKLVIYFIAGMETAITLFRIFSR